MARKQKQNPPRDELRCKAKTASKKRCKKARRNGNDYCEMHTKGAMDAARSKGGVVKAKVAKDFEEMIAYGREWPIGRDWNTRIDYLQAVLRKMKKHTAIRLGYEKQLHSAMDARDKYKAGGKIIALFLETSDGKTTRWAQPKGERPEPTEFEGGEQGFVPPGEDAA